jgi:hypothetical protein
VERRLLLRLGGVLSRTALKDDERLLRPSITEDCETALTLHATRLEQRLCRQAADRRPPAGDLRQLHRPALPLGAGHDADPAIIARLEVAALAAAALCYMSSALFWLFPFAR